MHRGALRVSLGELRRQFDDRVEQLQRELTC
jgi:hypothetical protein